MTKQTQQEGIIQETKREEWPLLLEIWVDAVRSTHHFLKEEDFWYYHRKILPDYFPNLKLFTLYEQKDTPSSALTGLAPAGFIGLSSDSIEMLFIHSRARGKEYGRALTNFATQKHHRTKVEVNEQNEQACGFYQAMGFEVVGRRALDHDQKPYPLLHLEKKQEESPT